MFQSLEGFPAQLDPLLAGLSAEDVAWRKDAASWSVLDIVNHLVDEEVEDFRRRIGLTLADVDRPWPGIDPEGRVIERRKTGPEFAEARSRFVEERERSVAWLRSLPEIDLELTYQHPSLGALRVGDLLLSWVSHDYLHLRQIAEIRFRLLQLQGRPFDSAYAGPW